MEVTHKRGHTMPRMRYAIYVLILLLLAYLLNQLDRYILSVVTKPMAQEVQYGDMQCMANASHGQIYNTTEDDLCNATSSARYVHVCVDLNFVL